MTNAEQHRMGRVALLSGQGRPGTTTAAIEGGSLSPFGCRGWTVQPTVNSSAAWFCRIAGVVVCVLTLSVGSPDAFAATEAERQAELDRLREVEAERERELDRMRQSEAELTEVRERLRQAEEELKRLEAQQEAGSGAGDADPVVHGNQTLESMIAAGAREAAGEPTEPDLAPCPILSASNASDLIPSYPRRGRFDYGSAVITVRFAVDEAGNTVDEEVAVIPERSRVDRPGHFDRFAQAAIEQVQGWAVEFSNQEELSCTMAQRASITVRFDF